MEEQQEYLADIWEFDQVPVEDSVEDGTEVAQLYSLEFGLDLPQTRQDVRAA